MAFMRFTLSLLTTLTALLCLALAPGASTAAAPQAPVPDSEAAFASAPKPPALHSGARAWVLVDGASGFVMGGSHADDPIDPDDLVQLMTLYTALEIVGDDDARLEEPVTISAGDSIRPLGSRRLYLVAGEQTPLKTLLNGIAVVAAEDAALAVANHLSGTVEAFVEAMNEAARSIGMTNSHFVSPIASSGQRTTARDLSKLAVAMHRRHPQAYAWFSQREFSFVNHTQRNRNLMLWKDAGVNGIMGSSDNTDLVTGWHRKPVNDDGAMPRDIFAVLIDAKNADLAASDMLTLLRYGRLEYETIRLFPAGAVIKRIDILSGNRDKLAVGTRDPVWVTVRRQDVVARGTGGFSTVFEYMAPAIAPVSRGAPAGTLHVYFRGRPVADFQLVAMQDVGPGSFLSRFVDSVRLRMKPVQDDRDGAAAKAGPETADSAAASEEKRTPAPDAASREPAPEDSATGNTASKQQTD